MITSIIAIIAALMQDHTVAIITSKTGSRSTYRRLPSTGEVCRIDETGRIIWYSNIWHLCRKMRLTECTGVHYDAAIIDKVQEEVRFLEGKEAAAKLIDPPPFLRLAA